MKTSRVLLGVSIVLSFVFSCKKEDVNTSEVRLLALETKDSSGTTSKTVFDYDNSGRIIKLQSESGGQSLVISTIVYQNNQVIITMPAINDVTTTLVDSIILTLDASNHVQKRIAYNFFEIKPPTNSPQRTYTYDTTNYSYDASGLLEKAISTHRDTTWFNPPTGVQTGLTIATNTTNYVNANGNVSAINTIGETTSISHQNGKTYTSKRTSLLNTSFEYTKGYANATDFTNAAVLFELGTLGLPVPLNSNYKNLPDRMRQITTDKDQNGVIISNSDVSTNVDLKYNSYGFISSANGAKFDYNR